MFQGAFTLYETARDLNYAVAANSGVFYSGGGCGDKWKGIVVVVGFFFRIRGVESRPHP
jgi:hypothetical protein